MLEIFAIFLLTYCPSSVVGDALPSFNYPNLGDDIYEQPVELMATKAPHVKNVLFDTKINELNSQPGEQDGNWDFDSFLNIPGTSSGSEHNRLKRSARRRGRVSKRRNRFRSTTTSPEEEKKNKTTTEVPIARRGSDKKRKNEKYSDTYEPPSKSYEAGFVEMPKDLYQAHLRPGVIFRIHLSEAVLKMQYRNYGEDKDESVIEADVEYLRLTRKVINDEITKFEDLQWLYTWFLNRSDLIQEHTCNTRYYAVGTPPTMFTHPEEYMKRLCLFDSVFIDHVPYVVGEDSSLMAAVAPPVLHCDAATCTTVPFIDSIMFDEKFSRTNVRTLTRCQASCRAHCKNNPDCLKRCSERCLSSD